MTIIDKIIEVNKYNRPCKYSKPVTICIHYTGQAKTGADRLAQYYANVASGVFKDKPSYTWTSTQYIVGQDGKIIRIIPDTEVAYAASGNNNGVIHIEVCYNNDNGQFEEDSIVALRELVQYLMKKYSIPANKVVRHYDLTGKHCPMYYVDQTRWSILHDRITAPDKPKKLYRVQVGAFSNKDNAVKYAEQIKAAGFNAFVVEV